MGEECSLGVLNIQELFKKYCWAGLKFLKYNLYQLNVQSFKKTALGSEH